jgi:hypothetical protein
MGIATGGIAPRGYLTEVGANPELDKFGLVESNSADYKVRTVCNVRSADATVIFADYINSDGTKLTIESCIKYQKPYLINPNAKNLRDWLILQQVKV